MANSQEIEPLKDNVLVFKGKTFQSEGDFAGPLFALGLGGSLVVAAVMGVVDLFVDYSHMFSVDTYMFSFTPMLNVLVFWPFFYGENTLKQLEKLGYKEKDTNLTAGQIFKSWYGIPSKSKKVQLGKTYINMGGRTEKVTGDLKGRNVPLGKATHEITDYLVTDFKGIRMERHIEPTPLMLWDDALNTIDEGFGLRKMS